VYVGSGQVTVSQFGTVNYMQIGLEIALVFRSLVSLSGAGRTQTTMVAESLQFIHFKTTIITQL
jgi:hypothetical protein